MDIQSLLSSLTAVLQFLKALFSLRGGKTDRTRSGAYEVAPVEDRFPAPLAPTDVAAEPTMPRTIAPRRRSTRGAAFALIGMLVAGLIIGAVTMWLVRGRDERS